MDVGDPVTLTAKDERAGQSIRSDRPSTSYQSSLRITPLPTGSEIVALVRECSVTEKLSFGSFTLSPLIYREIVADVCPAGIVKVPDLAT